MGVGEWKGSGGEGETRAWPAADRLALCGRCTCRCQEMAHTYADTLAKCQAENRLLVVSCLTGRQEHRLPGKHTGRRAGGERAGWCLAVACAAAGEAGAALAGWLAGGP